MGSSSYMAIDDQLDLIQNWLDCVLDSSVVTSKAGRLQLIEMLQEALAELEGIDLDEHNPSATSTRPSASEKAEIRKLSSSPMGTLKSEESQLDGHTEEEHLAEKTEASDSEVVAAETNEDSPEESLSSETPVAQIDESSAEPAEDQADQTEESSPRVEEVVSETESSDEIT
ncbi:MAG: hypothetical protein K2Z81_09620, partial [Cyanobacteria bacterium]|nr:hypothetical protein [Cyanobacteriota bacterium]